MIGKIQLQDRNSIKFGSKQTNNKSVDYKNTKPNSEYFPSFKGSYNTWNSYYFGITSPVGRYSDQHGEGKKLSMPCVKCKKSQDGETSEANRLFQEEVVKDEPNDEKLAQIINMEGFSPSEGSETEYYTEDIVPPIFQIVRKKGLVKSFEAMCRHTQLNPNLTVNKLLTDDIGTFTVLRELVRNGDSNFISTLLENNPHVEILDVPSGTLFRGFDYCSPDLTTYAKAQIHDDEKRAEIIKMLEKYQYQGGREIALKKYQDYTNDNP